MPGGCSNHSHNDQHTKPCEYSSHLFHLASDVVELAFFVPEVLSALVEAQEEARLAIQRLSNPDPNDETTIAGHTLFSRGGRPVTADPVKDFRGHSDAFVMRTLRTAGPALGLDGLQPGTWSGTPNEETCTEEHIIAAQQLEATLTTESRGMMLRAVPSRLHREWAHAHELVLHCYESVHRSWSDMP